MLLLKQRLKRLFLGPPKNPLAPQTRQHMALAAFVAWVGLGADGLSSANYGPEEAFVASLSACHMLWFLHIARDAGFTVASYRDEAEGLMAKNEDGKLAMTKVTLKPYIVFKGNQPSPQDVDHLHHRAHDECYIANSVKTDVAVEPQGRT